MNIFWLDSDHETAAKYYVDKHIVKIPIEISQMCCTALQRWGYEHPSLYNPTHKNHKLTKWVGDSVHHFLHAKKHCQALNEEWKFRYNHPPEKDHKSWLILNSIPESQIKKVLPDNEFVDPPLCMAENCKSTDVVTSYREYYRTCKSHLFSWKNRPTPYWI